MQPEVRTEPTVRVVGRSFVLSGSDISDAQREPRVLLVKQMVGSLVLASGQIKKLASPHQVSL